MVGAITKVTMGGIISRILTALAVGAIVGSCTVSDPASGERIALSSKTCGIETRSTIWSGGEQVRVSVDGADDEPFTISDAGVLTPANTLWWQSSTQTISARAWYPDRWTFPVDQSAGIEGADCLFAPTVGGITFRNAASTPLLFHHRTSKVTINLTAGEGVASVAGAKVAISGYKSGAVDTSHAGGGKITGFDNAWITPYKSAGDSYTALVIPRDMTGQRFIRVTLGGFDHYYIPAHGQAALVQGCAYAYDIKVEKTRLVVSVDVGAEWSNGGEQTIVGDVI